MKTVTSSKERNGVEVKYTPVDDSSQNQCSETQLQGVNESENLIICDSQLASSFQEVKIKSRRKPGHYLQKVFLHKLKSQSVPILDNENDSNSDNNEESTSPPVEELKEIPKEGNDNWFKTWPDCTLRNGLVESNDNKIQVDNSKKTIGCTVSCSDNCHTNPNTPVPLDNALHSLPLAYSPVTKQIHLICQNDLKSVKSDSKCNGVSLLNRVGTEVSSFSSTVSSLSDISPSTNGDSTLGIFDNGDNCSLISIGNCSSLSEDSNGTKPKRKGISAFFSRGVFGWKGKNDTSEGWSLFSKHSGSDISPSSGLSEERHSAGGDSSHGVLGSTGLIQLERPAWLPAKSKQEQLAHSNQHNRIISSARKRELKEAKQRKKLLQNQLKAEDELANATKIWIQEILPKWHQMKNYKRTQELWWQGVPPCVRGKLWRLALTNDLNVTHDLYDICVSRAVERLKSAAGSTDSIDEPSKDRDAADREASMELIQLDISRTFPHLCIFQKKGPYYDMLHSLLAAYVCYRPDVGYVQGMSFIAAVLILNMDAPDAFVCFANLLNRPCHRAFYSLDQPLMEAYYATYKALLRENLPKLCEHLDSCRLTPDLYLLDWVYTIYAKAMSLDLASRIWDVFLRDGDEFLFRTAIGVLKLSQDQLLGMDFLTGSQYLTKLPEYLTATQLFKSIASVKMNIGKADFSQLLATQTQMMS